MDGNAFYTEEYQEHIPHFLLLKSCALIIELASQLFFTEERMQLINSLKRFLKSMNIVDQL